MDDACLLTYLSEENFLPDLKSKDRTNVLEELIQPLIESEKIKSPKMLMDILQQRESLGSTAIVKQVAIPHCRTLIIADTHVIMGISKEGVDFDAPDKKPVHLFFLVVAPPQEKENMYLPILGRICEILRDKKKKKALLKVDDFSAIEGILKG
jgi:PTS system nitrogen regulatory IIA component